MSLETRVAVEKLSEEMRGRSHRLVEELQKIVANAEKQGVQISISERDLNKLGKKVSDLELHVDLMQKSIHDVDLKATWLSASAATLAFVVNMIPWPWKHP